MDTVLKRKRKARESVSKFRLPDEGVLLPDGTPFYHVVRKSLKPEHQKRLDECGVRMLKGTFTKDEDEKIQRNWIAYAREENISVDRAFEYAGGFRDQLMKTNEFRDYVLKQDQTRFLPRICKDLNNRTARQVTERMRRLYHPALERDYAGYDFDDLSSRNWTEKEVEDLRRLMALDTSVPVMSVKLKRTKIAVETKINEIRGMKKSGRQPLPVFAWNDESKLALIKFVDRSLCIDGEDCDKERKRLIEGLIEETGGCDSLHLAMSSLLESSCAVFNWNPLSEKLLAPVEELRRLWLEQAKLMQETYASCDGDTQRTWSQLGECFVPHRTMSFEEWRKILKLILRQKPVNYSSIDGALLQAKLVEKGLVDYYTRGLPASRYCLHRLQDEVYGYRKIFRKDLPEVKLLNYTDWIKCFRKALKAALAGEEPSGGLKPRRRQIMSKKCVWIGSAFMKPVLMRYVEEVRSREDARKERLSMLIQDSPTGDS